MDIFRTKRRADIQPWILKEATTNLGAIGEIAAMVVFSVVIVVAVRVALHLLDRYLCRGAERSEKKQETHAANTTIGPEKCAKHQPHERGRTAPVATAAHAQCDDTDVSRLLQEALEHEDALDSILQDALEGNEPAAERAKAPKCPTGAASSKVAHAEVPPVVKRGAPALDAVLESTAEEFYVEENMMDDALAEVASRRSD